MYRLWFGRVPAMDASHARDVVIVSEGTSREQSEPLGLLELDQAVASAGDLLRAALDPDVWQVLVSSLNVGIEGADEASIKFAPEAIEAAWQALRALEGEKTETD